MIVVRVRQGESEVANLSTSSHRVRSPSRRHARKCSPAILAARAPILAHCGMEPIDTLISRPLGHSDRARRACVLERPCGRDSPGPHRGGPADAPRRRSAFRAAETLERPTHVLLPGLVNAHTHAAMSLLRGAAESTSFEHWLTQQIRPLRAALDRCRIRARRHRAGDRRHADERHDLFRRHAPVPGSGRADRAAAHMRACIGLPVQDTPTRVGRLRQRMPRQGLRAARRVSRRSADHDRARARVDRAASATRR